MHAVDSMVLDPAGHSSNEPSFVTEANHRIANNLALIVSAVKARAADVAARDRLMRPAEVAHILDDVSGRIATVGLLHRLLSQSLGRSTIDLADYLDRVATTTLAALGAEDRVELNWTSEGGCAVGSEQALPIALILAEVLTNTVKYAHPAGGTTRVWLACTRRSDASLMIDITDDGIGLPDGFDPETDGGVGLRTVRALATQLDAQILFRSGPLGCGVTLVAPPRAVHAPRLELVS